MPKGIINTAVRSPIPQWTAPNKILETIMVKTIILAKVIVL